MRLGLLCGLLLMGASLAYGAEAGSIDITAERLDVRQTDGKATFTGRVVAKRGAMTLHADTLTATYGKGHAAPQRGQVESIIAAGHVTLLRAGTGDEKATGDAATYNIHTHTLVLTGRAVTLTRGASMLVGDKLVYDLTSGHAKVTQTGGQVKARFVPQGQ